jgi:hypothetical protein
MVSIDWTIAGFCLIEEGDHMADLTELVRIDDPQFYVNNPYPVFARMRREAPACVYHLDGLG